MRYFTTIWCFFFLPFFLRLVLLTYLHVFSKCFVVVVVFLFCFVLKDVLTHHINECCLNQKEQIYINLLEIQMFNSNPHNEAAVLLFLHPTCFSFSN